MKPDLPTRAARADGPDIARVAEGEPAPLTLPRLPASGAPPVPPARTLLLAGLGAGLAILALCLLARATDTVLLMAPFGASAVLLFALPDAPLSQPRAVIGGHMVATAVGLLVAQALGTGPFAMALAVGLAVTAMLLTRTTHAPAGADPLLVMLTGQGWAFLATPVGAGALLLVLAAWLCHRAMGTARYPRYWY